MFHFVLLHSILSAFHSFDHGCFPNWHTFTCNSKYVLRIVDCKVLSKASIPLGLSQPTCTENVIQAPLRCYFDLRFTNS